MIRRHLHSIIAAAALIAAIIAEPRAHAGTASVAEGLAKAAGNKVVAILSNPYLTSFERESRLRTVYITFFDHSAISKWALGPRWRWATKEEQMEFGELLEDFVVRSIAKNLSHYEADRILVTRSEVRKSALIVRSQIVLADPQASRSVPVIWRLNRELKIYDVAIDGVSLAVSLRREISAMLNQGGGTIKGLLAVLRRRLDQSAAIHPDALRGAMARLLCA
jgi:phospholipid transport system substrate-binding protein